MHLSLKTIYLAGAVNVLLWFFCLPPAQALDGHVTKRTPFCLKAETPCQAIFHLNITDNLKILRQSIDEKWYLVQYVDTQQKGWVSAQFIQIKLPTKLISKNVPIPEMEAQALRLYKQSLQILSKTESRSPLSDRPTQKIYGLEQLLPTTHYRWNVLNTSEADPWVIGMTEVDDHFFVQSIKTGAYPQAEFNTLINIKQSEDFKGSALIQNKFIILLAKGIAPWGESFLSVLDTHYVPLMLFKEDRELLDYLPQKLITNIRPDSLKLLSLDQEGLLLATAYHIYKRTNVLLVLRFDPKETWVYEGMYHWPKEIKINLKSSDFKTRALKQGEHFFLLVESETKSESFLAFYAGKNDPVTLQALNQQVLDAVLYQEELWTLHQNKLLHWVPVFAPDAPE